MDRFAEHLEVVSFPAAAACAAAAIALLFFTPSRVRLPLALAVMVIVLTLSRLAELGAISSLAKVLSGFSFGLVAIAAYLQPGRRLLMPKYCWGYALVGAAAIWYVAQTEDRSLAIALRAQWLLLAVSALLTARTVADDRSLRRVLVGLSAGGGIACLITFSAIAVAPIQALQNGFGRFMPYQANPNQIGVLFAVNTALALYFSLQTNSSLARACFIGITAVALSQSVLTLSRGSFIVVGCAATPSVFVALRRPLFAIFSLTLLGMLLVSLVRVAESSDFERVGNGIDERTWLALDVLDEVKERPLWGLANTDGFTTYNPDLNAHNAYVEMLYIGGVSLAGPIFALQLWGHWNMARLWLMRRRLPFDPLAISVLAGFSAALVLHGFVNDIIYHPTYTWAFLNVFLACLSISLGRCAARAHAGKRHDFRAARQFGTKTFRLTGGRGGVQNTSVPLRPLQAPV